MHKLPVFPEFEPIDLKHKDTVEAALRDYYPRISEFTFSEIYAWRTTRGTMVSSLNSNVIFRFHKNENIYFAEPIGKNLVPETIKQVLEWAVGHGIKDAHIFGATPELIDGFKEKKEWFTVEDDRQDYDYMYLAQDLIELKGRKYDAKRNHIKKFLKSYSFDFRQMDGNNAKECAAFQEKWCALKPCPEGTLLYEENAAVMEILNHFGKLSCIGGVLYVNGKAEGFTIAGELNPETVVIYMEKANHEFKGIYQALNQMFAEKSLSKYKYINREQDVGDEGLRKAKLSYQPVFLIEKRQLKLKPQA